MKNDQGTEGDDGTTIVLSDVLERLEHLEARVELLESQVDERRVDEDMRGSRPTTSRDVAERRYYVVLRGRFDEDTNTFVSGVFDNLEDFNLATHGAHCNESKSFSDRKKAEAHCNSEIGRAQAENNLRYDPEGTVACSVES